MSSTISRRSFLISLAAGATVVGFDPLGRSWVTEAEAAPLVGIPPLDGELLTDPASLQQAANDFGHIVHRTSRAVLRPGSVDDIVTMVRFCNRHLIPVAARGQGHSTFGQPQVEDGLVIDMGPLSTVHHVGADRAVVDAGTVWSEVLTAALEEGKAPPVMTDFLELSVGGTLTVGGIGGTTFRHGFQVDNVLSLEVVTGEGRLVTCSPRRNRDLFEAVLAGLGQCALIVRATVRMVRATELVRVYLLTYSDLAAFTSDQRLLIADGRFDYVEGQVVPDPAGGWSFLLEAAKFFTPPRLPDDEVLLDGLQFDSGGMQEPDLTYSEFQNRLAFLPSIPGWTTDPHPWINLFVPASFVDDYVSDVLVDLEAGDVNGPILLYPFWSRRATRPMLQIPDQRVVFLLALLRTAVPVPSVPSVDEMLRSNRELFEQARDVGGKQYPIGAIPFTRSDWRDHFGDQWDRLVAAKRRYDPNRILTPGQGIFRPPS
ncbi:MAG TPA: FAD-binding protein [Jiangellaceae bacterium]